MEFFIISNKPSEVEIWDKAGVDFIFIDLEVKGKNLRQKGLNTFISDHTIEDISRLRPLITKGKLLVRINPLDKDSKEEVLEVIERGADAIMLPMFRTANDLMELVELVRGRCSIIPLIETPEALDRIEDLTKVKGIDSFHIGLNDLSIALEYSFMFEVIEDKLFLGAVNLLREKRIKYGFGGVARFGGGQMPAELIICQHKILGSTRVILSRSFKEDVKSEDSEEEIKKIRTFYSDLNKNKLSKANLEFKTKLKEITAK